VQLIGGVWAPGTPEVLRTLEAVALLRRIVVQTYLVTTDARGRAAAATHRPRRPG
jgi:hypothetical protein